MAQRVAKRRGVTRWPATIVLALLLLLQVASVPFYAGWSWTGGKWRLEHGRLTIQRSDVLRPKGPWVAGNTEGLRWTPAARVHAADDWTVTIPLWCLYVPAALWTMWAWRGRPA